MASLITFASGQHRECLLTMLPRLRKWAKLHNVGLFPIIADSPPVVNGGAACMVKFYAIKEVLGYQGELTPQQMEHGAIDQNELVIWLDCDTVPVNTRAASPALIERTLGDKDITSLLHPDEPTAKKMGCGRHFFNGGLFAFRNNQKMRDYFNAAWSAPTIQASDLSQDVASTMQKWYMERWKVGTDEMKISQDIYDGKLTFAELDRKWNHCWECKRDPVTGLSDIDACYFYHYAWLEDKETVVRRMKSLIHELESKGM